MTDVNGLAEGDCSSVSFKSCWRLCLILFFTLFFTYSYFYQSGQHNENARFDQLRSIVERGSFDVDYYAYNTADIILENGHYYPNKVPGLTIAGLPAWWAASQLLHLFDVVDRVKYPIACYLTTVTTVSFSGALVAVLVFLILSDMVLSKESVLLAALASGIGTIMFPYSTLFFSHMLTTALIFISFFCIYSATRAKHRVFLSLFYKLRWLLPLLAGLTCGLAVSCDYPAALAVLPLSAYALYCFGPGWRFVAFVGGGVLAGLLLLGYNQICFGDPFFITYSAYTSGNDEVFSEHKKGFMGVSLPRLDTLYYITLSLERGILVFSPWLLLVLPGIYFGFKNKNLRAEVLLCACMIILFLAFNAGYAFNVAFAGGGTSIGPRHIIPMLPFACILVGLSLRHAWCNRAMGVLLPYSFAVMIMGTAVEPRVPYEYSDPIRAFFVPHYLRGLFSQQHEELFNSPPIVGEHAAFNLGRAIGLPTVLELAPLIVVWIAVIFQMRKKQLLNRFNSSALALVLVCLFIAPTSYAFCTKFISEKNGLNGNYYRGTPWEKCPHELSAPNSALRLIYSEINPQVNFSWSGGPPLGAGVMSVFWSGKLNVPDDGELYLGTASDDGSCLYLDGKLLVNNWGSHPSNLINWSGFVKRGQHNLCLWFDNRASGASMSLYWGRRAGELTVIPASALFPK